MPGPRQPGQAEEKLGDEEPGSVAPFDSCTLMSMYCMKDKSDFSFLVFWKQNLSIILFLWIFQDVWKHQSCGMKCYNFLMFNVLNKMNLFLLKLFSFTFM